MFNTFSRPLLDPRHYRMDDLLRCPYSAATPFSCAGEIVWADAPQGWGFRGGVHIGQKTSPEGIGPFTLTLSVEGEPIEPGDALYRPSHVTLNGRHEDSGLQVTEDKFITDDDVIVSVISLRNPSDVTVAVELDYSWGIGSGAAEIAGNAVWIRREAPAGDDLIQSLSSGARRTLVFAAAVAPSREEAFYRSAYWRDRENPAYAQATAYQNWFTENAPRFDCSDPWLTTLWYQQWAAVRRLRGETDEAEKEIQGLLSSRADGVFQAVTEYAKAQCSGGDFTLPRDPDTRAPVRYSGTTQPAFCRLIQEQLLGVAVRDDETLVVAPTLPLPEEGGWAHFCLENFSYQGRLFTIVWDDPRDPSVDVYQDGDMGLTVYADGRRIYHQENLNPFSVELPLQGMV